VDARSVGCYRIAVTPILPVDFYRRDVLAVARDLVGKRLCRDAVALEITEVEAYREGDSAAHTRHGVTARNAAIWGPPGRAYIYLCYGMHQMLNVVTGEDGHGAAVLVRACRPIAGLEVVRARRGGLAGPALLTGPGKVGQALGLDATRNHHALYEPGGLELRDGPAPGGLLVGPRVGIDYAAPEHRDAPWRFALADTPWVSHRKRLTPL
jgi:DNA-3-methyladenine glycosylase